MTPVQAAIRAHNRVLPHYLEITCIGQNSLGSNVWAKATHSHTLAARNAMVNIIASLARHYPSPSDYCETILSWRGVTGVDRT